ncbi:MAG TPA: NADH:flavin oxidoreductase [Clostridia bacterium]|nr:NADH:flavin oxidoreductase [Clostridia bacterium]
MKTIFDRLIISGLEIKNRIATASVGRNLADLDGHIPESLYDIYKELAEGGAGLIISEMTMVSVYDYPVPGFTRLQDDAVIPEYKKLTDMVHQADALMVAQLAYGGYFRGGAQIIPDEMTQNELREVVQDFISAAVRAKKAGFDGVELHCAHGFLLNKIMSPAFNHRTDEYGGSIENRCRLTLEIIRGIREQCDDLPILAKINSTDGRPDGIREEESIAICKLIEAAGIDIIEVSGMDASVSKIKPGDSEGYFASFGKELKRNISIPVILTGGHRSKEHMEQILNEDACDMFSVARPLIREPGLIARWQNGDLRPSDCVSCNMCYKVKGHKCIRGTLHPDGTITKNERE